MKRIVRNIAAAALLAAGVSAQAAGRGAYTASIKGDADMTVAKADGEAKGAAGADAKAEIGPGEADSPERVSEGDASPGGAEIAENRDFDAGRIAEPSVRDSADGADEPSVRDEIAAADKPSPAATESPKVAEPTKPAEQNPPAAEKSAEAVAAAGQEGADAPAKPGISPSRTVTMKNHQQLSVTYPGGGWSFMGELDAAEGAAHLLFLGKRLGRGDTGFALRSTKPGEATLHFYKNDALTGRYIDDYLLVKIDEESATGREPVSAPLYAEAVPGKPDMSADARRVETVGPDAAGLSPLPENPSAGKPVAAAEGEPKAEAAQADGDVRTVVQSAADGGAASPAQPSGVAASPEGNFTHVTDAGGKPAEPTGTPLERAQAAFDAGRHAEALKLAREALDSAENADRALFLLGQVLEAKSGSRDIRKAIESYSALVRDFPTSELWTTANQRLIFLRRFYIDIR